MRTWGELLQHIRLAILKDNTPDEETGEYRFSTEELLICAGWALSQFAAHTAMATSVVFTPATGTTYELPAEIYDGDTLEQVISVGFYDGKELNYLDPVRYTDGMSPNKEITGFSIFPDRILNIPQAGNEASTLTLRYFAYWPTPSAPEDIIQTPRWAEVGLCYLIGAHALAGAGLKAAVIRQWGARPDTGSPEDNPLRVQQEWFMKLYECELRKRLPQDRINAFRASYDTRYL